LEVLDWLGDLERWECQDWLKGLVKLEELDWLEDRDGSED
jgi:hypothetical protein